MYKIAFHKFGHIYHMYLYINSSSHIVPSSGAQYSLTLHIYVDHKK